MGINIPSLFDICCYRFAEEGKYCSELVGHEKAVKRIEDFIRLISGKSLFAKTDGGALALPALKYLLGKEREQYIKKLGESLQLVETHSKVLGVRLPVVVLADAMPPLFFLERISREAKDSLISLYLFTKLPVDMEVFETFCRT